MNTSRRRCTEVSIRRLRSGAMIATDVRGSGEPVIFMHGLAGFKELWTETIEALGERKWTTVAFDHRGHGGSSDQPIPWSIADLSDDLEMLVDDLSLERVWLVGHSMGGRVLFHFALAHPRRIAGLVLVGAQSEAPTGWYRDELAQVLRAVRNFGLDGFRLAFRDANELPERIDKDAAYSAWFFERFNRNRPRALETSLTAILDMPSLTARLSEITVPVLVVVGERDRAFTEIAQHYSSVIPSCTVVVVPGCTHYPMVDQPKHFGGILLDFLLGRGDKVADHLPPS